MEIGIGIGTLGDNQILLSLYIRPIGWNFPKRSESPVHSVFCQENHRYGMISDGLYRSKRQ